ncbi:MAG: NAD-dependent epimerase/dehydratase family protein, partial [Bacteroidota bacterium]
HVLPALIRKIHLGKALENSDWTTIDKDLNHLPIEGVSGNSSESEKLAVLQKYGITRDENNHVSVEIWGSGKPMREFLWSEDMADACVFIMEKRDFSDTYETGSKEIRNTHVNIGTGKDISIGDLAGLIKQKLGFEGDFAFNTEKPDGTMKKLTDVTKLQQLGWKHTVELDMGIEKMYQWFLQKPLKNK